jgi:hypothetical protein
MSDQAWDDLAAAVADANEVSVSALVPSSFSDEDILTDHHGPMFWDANVIAQPYTFAGTPTMSVVTDKDGVAALKVTFPMIRESDGTKDGKPVLVKIARDQSLYLQVDRDHWVVAGWYGPEKVVS